MVSSRSNPVRARVRVWVRATTRVKVTVRFGVIVRVRVKSFFDANVDFRVRILYG